MAEAVAAVSLVASILQLVDFSSKLVGRLKDFSDIVKDVPETFRTISVQLPLAANTLQRLREHIEGAELSESEVDALEADALKALVDRCVVLVEELNRILDKVVPSKNSSPLGKQILAIRSLRHDRRIQNASLQLLQNVHLLVFHQTTRIQGVVSHLSRKFSGTALSMPVSAINFDHGLNFGGAPRLAAGKFVGREMELKQLRDMLEPKSQSQDIVAVVGMGGIGKTQLSIQYAVNYQEQYSSVFWLNAQDEFSLRTDLINMSEIILTDQMSSSGSKAEENAIIQKIRRWLSHTENRGWLLIFDNLDNPKVPGNDDHTAYDVREYFPYRSQGSILITTRSRKISFAKQLPLQKLDSVAHGLEILSSRSERDFSNDPEVMDLVMRLDGLPLALASAGSFFDRKSCTVKEYLEEYERNRLEEEGDSLFEYGDRTLSTAWNMSFEKLKSQSPESAGLLRVLAFFGPQDIDYQLLLAQEPAVWGRLDEVLCTKPAFYRSMAKLRDFSLIETSRNGYRLHPCLHDWALSNLNPHIDEQDIWPAVCCIVSNAESRSSIWSKDYRDSFSRWTSHASRMTHPRIFEVLLKAELGEWRSAVLCGLGQLLRCADRNLEAEQLVHRSLDWSQQHLGPDHEDCLAAREVLGLIHMEQQNFTKAESLLMRAVQDLERTVGRHNKRTLDPVHNLALLYMQLDRPGDAEQMFRWSLEGCEESLRSPRS